MEVAMFAPMKKTKKKTKKNHYGVSQFFECPASPISVFMSAYDLYLAMLLYFHIPVNVYCTRKSN